MCIIYLLWVWAFGTWISQLLTNNSSAKILIFTKTLMNKSIYEMGGMFARMGPLAPMSVPRYVVDRVKLFVPIWDVLLQCEFLELKFPVKVFHMS